MYDFVWPHSQFPGGPEDFVLCGKLSTIMGGVYLTSYGET